MLELLPKAEKLVNQGHWPEAHYLFEQVLAYLPQHLHYAAQSTQTKPCQLVCLISGLRDCAVYQSEILNTMGQQQGAYQVLNQSYALLQFYPSKTVHWSDPSPVS